MSRHDRILALALLLGLSTAARAAEPAPMYQAAEPAPRYKEFGRWLVACDNVRSCVARGFDETTRAELDLTRPAGDATAELTLSADGALDPGALRLDGAPIALPKPGWTVDDGTLSTQDPAVIAAFIAAARDGDTITLDPTPDGGAAGDARTVPLDGFSAALRLVDAVQGRPGTPTALIATKGAAAPPPAPPLPPRPRWVTPPKLTAPELRRLRAQAAQLRSPSFDPCNVRQPVDLYPLDAANALAIRPCYLAAYQGSSVVAVLPRAGGPARPVVLSLAGLPGGTDGPDMVDPAFDPETGALFSVSKGRGLGDCGSDERWVWSAGAFRRRSLSYQDLCGGAAAGDWPVLYRTR